jgi:riboflavin transporter FmnP
MSEKRSEQVKEKRLFTTKNMAIIATLSSVSFILYLFVKFPLPFLFPGFLDMQFSDLPALLGGFSLGPSAGAIIIIVKCLLKMPFSSTACVGELADAIIGLANVVPAAIFYKKRKTKKSAILAMIIGTVSAMFFALLANRFILIPFFKKAYGMDAILKMVSSIYPNANAQNFYSYYLPLAVLPFNALRCIVCAIITYYTYKPLFKIINKI